MLNDVFIWRSLSSTGTNMPSCRWYAYGGAFVTRVSGSQLTMMCAAVFPAITEENFCALSGAHVRQETGDLGFQPLRLIGQRAGRAEYAVSHFACLRRCLLSRGDAFRHLA